MRRTTRIGAVVATAGLLSAALWGPSVASAEISESFAGEANSSLLNLDAVNFGALTGTLGLNDSLAKVGVAPTQAQANSPDGLGGDVLTRGFGQNLDLSLLGSDVPLDLSTAEQTAPPDHTQPDVSEAIGLDDLDPLLTGSVSKSTALARDPAAISCPSDGQRTTVSSGVSETTDLGVLDIGNTSLLSVTDNDGTLAASSGVFIGSDGQVIGESSAQGASINLADELVIEVSNPVLTATATGTSGGASVNYSGEVRINGEKIAGTQENEISLDALTDVLLPLDEALNPILDSLDQSVLDSLEGPLQDILDPLGITNLTLPDLRDLIAGDSIDVGELLGIRAVALVTAGQLQNVQESADGTSASGSVSAVSIDLNLVSSLTDTTIPILALDVAPMSASAQAPQGGIDCGRNPFRNLRKDSVNTVMPGDSFDYTITVPNDASCTVTDVTIQDQITGPDGFTISSTSPQADSVNGNTVTWTTDSIAAGDNATFVVTVQTPSNAQQGDQFSDTVDVTAQCNGTPVDGTFTLNKPTVGGNGNLPRTGGGFALLGVGAVALATKLRNRRG